jgi:hypothetical protein
MLVSPSSFGWAKSFLSSRAGDLLTNGTAASDSVPFCFPLKCPDARDFLCPISLPSIVELPTAYEIDSLGDTDILSPSTPADTLKSHVSSSPGPWSANLLDLVAKGKEPVSCVDSSARRSLKQKNKHKGFKSA